MSERALVADLHLQGQDLQGPVRVLRGAEHGAQGHEDLEPTDPLHLGRAARSPHLAPCHPPPAPLLAPSLLAHFPLPPRPAAPPDLAKFPLQRRSSGPPDLAKFALQRRPAAPPAPAKCALHRRPAGPPNHAHSAMPPQRPPTSTNLCSQNLCRDDALQGTMVLIVFW